MHVTTSPLNRIDQDVDKSARHGMTGTHKDEDLAKNIGPFYVVRIQRRTNEEPKIPESRNLDNKISTQKTEEALPRYDENRIKSRPHA